MNCFPAQIRLLTLRILSQFEAELPPQAEVRPSVPILIKLDRIQETISSRAYSCECVPLCPGWGERGGAAGVRSLPAGRAGAGFSAGLQRQAASPPEAETRPGAAQSAAGAARHLSAGTEEALLAVVSSSFHHLQNSNTMTLMISDMLFKFGQRQQQSFDDPLILKTSLLFTHCRFSVLDQTVALRYIHASIAKTNSQFKEINNGALSPLLASWYYHYKCNICHLLP